MKRYTLIELKLVIAIIRILVTILFLSLSIAKLKALVAVCMPNLSKGGKGLDLFSNDNNGRYLSVWRDNKTARVIWAGIRGKNWHQDWTFDYKVLNPYLGFVSDDDIYGFLKCPGMDKRRFTATGNNYALPHYLGPGSMETEEGNLFKSKVSLPSRMISLENDMITRLTWEAIYRYEGWNGLFLAHGAYYKKSALFHDGHIKENLI